jgi:hypothetical protein
MLPNVYCQNCKSVVCPHPKVLYKSGWHVIKGQKVVVGYHIPLHFEVDATEEKLVPQQ